MTGNNDEEPLSEIDDKLIRKMNYVFHGIMSLTALYVFMIYDISFVKISRYMAMVLTNWGTELKEGEPTEQYDVSVQSLWVKTATLWVTMGLYIWTLVAPYAFPDRNFN